MNRDSSSPDRLAGRRSGAAGESFDLRFWSLILRLVTMQLSQISNANSTLEDNNGIFDEISKATGEVLFMVEFGVIKGNDTEISSLNMFSHEDEVVQCVIQDLDLTGRNEGDFKGLKSRDLAPRAPELARRVSWYPTRTDANLSPNLHAQL